MPGDVNPKKCYRLKSPIYGVAGANHEWDVLLKSANSETCGFSLSEVELGLYAKIVVDDSDCVVD